jgi:hypothetical protein
MTSAEYAAADQYIQSREVAELNVTSESVHENLWPLFQKLLATTNDEGWAYASAFKSALESIKNEYSVNNGGILEDKNLQYRMCFYFILYIHH